MLRLTLAEHATAHGARALQVRAGRMLRALMHLRRGAAGPIELSLMTSLGVSVWRKHLARAGREGVVEVELHLPPDLPSGGTWLVAQDVRTGVIEALRFELEGCVPVRPVWRYRQRIMMREAAEASRVEVSALVPRGMPLKLAVAEAGLWSPVESSHDDAYGNRWAHASFDSRALDASGVRAAHGFTPSGRKRPARPLLQRERDLVSFTTGAHLPSLRNSLDQHSPLAVPAHLRRFLESEPSIESDAPEVLELAEAVPHADDAGPLGVCEAAHRTVRKHMRYVIQRGEFGACYAARRGVGDCTEYAALFVALCRARGVPARVAAGFFPDQRNSAHATAEVYLQGLWFGLDPTNLPRFHLGLPASFVPMMRANWMSGETAYQPFTASLESRGVIPELRLSEGFTRATPGSAAQGVEHAWVGGEWLARDRRRPSMSATLEPPTGPDQPGRVLVWLINDTDVAWRVQLLAAVEPRTPMAYAIRELRLEPGEGHRLELPHPHSLRGLEATEGLLLTLWSGEKLLDAQPFG